MLGGQELSPESTSRQSVKMQRLSLQQGEGSETSDEVLGQPGKIEPQEFSITRKSVPARPSEAGPSTSAVVGDPVSGINHVNTGLSTVAGYGEDHTERPQVDQNLSNIQPHADDDSNWLYLNYGVGPAPMQRGAGYPTEQFYHSLENVNSTWNAQGAPLATGEVPQGMQYGVVMEDLELEVGGDTTEKSKSWLGKKKQGALLLLASASSLAVAGVSAYAAIKEENQVWDNFLDGAGGFIAPRVTEVAASGLLFTGGIYMGIRGVKKFIK